VPSGIINPVFCLGVFSVDVNRVVVHWKSSYARQIHWFGLPTTRQLEEKLIAFSFLVAGAYDDHLTNEKPRRAIPAPSFDSKLQISGTPAEGKNATPSADNGPFFGRVPLLRRR
jgi:hypothetical protein